METFKLCVGCRYLSPGKTSCMAINNMEERYNPYLGRNEVLYHFWPSVHLQRSEAGYCGPERKLYKPTWRRMFLCWIGFYKGECA